MNFAQAFEACAQQDFEPERTPHYVIAHDPEEDAIAYVELYLTEGMCHWHTECKRELQSGEVLVLIVSKNKLQTVVRREFDNLTKDEIIQYAKAGQ